MKKRILSVLLVFTMLFASSVCTFAYNEYDVLNKVGAVLDELNSDAVSGQWQKDIDYHAAQLAAIEEVYALIDSADISDVIERILEHDGLTTNQKLYLCALANESDPAVAAVLHSYNTAGLTWRESFDPLQDFAEDALQNNTHIIAPPGAPSDVEAEYDNVLADSSRRAAVASYIETAIKNLLKISFSPSSANLALDYDNGIEADDITKKTLMVFASEVIEKEGIPFRTASGVDAIITAGTDYALSFKNDANIAMVKDAVDRVASAELDETIALAFDEAIAGVNAVNGGYFTGREIYTDIRLLVGTSVEDGIVEAILKAVDDDFEATGMLLNIALSKGIQLYRPAGRMQDINENTASPADFSNVTFSHGNSITVKTEDFSSIREALAPIPLTTSWFDIVFYDEDGDKLTGIAYNDGTISVMKDVSRGVENAYVVLYRKDAEGGAKAFIESYPVKVDFTEGISLPPSTGGSTAKRYTVTFVTNGGSEIAPMQYTAGTTVRLTMAPTKEGYIFAGWYSDAELTNKIDSIVVNADTTVYAGWTKDGSAVVSKVDVPALLEGEDHYAYVMGYPEGDIRPNGNITRAEAVTMIFRLLKDEVRTANITEENVFEDVNSDDWFNTAVSTLAKLGVVEGRTQTQFAPNAKITRAEFATMFARLAQYEFTAKNIYKDVENHWAKSYIDEVDAYGWIAGYEDDTFRPDNAITRAEAMTLINRVLKRTPQDKTDLLDGMTIWTDNDETAWYYIAVQEATNSHEYERKADGSFEKWTKLVENKDWTTFEK